MISMTVTGRLARDPELRQAGSTPVLSMSIPSEHYAKGRGPDGKDYVTTWVRVSLFGKRAESLAGKLAKGSLVTCRGLAYLEEYNGKTSLNLKADDVEHHRERQGGGSRESAGYGGGGGDTGGYGGSGGYGSVGGTPDDDVPFMRPVAAEDRE